MELLTVQDLARILKVCPGTIYKHTSGARRSPILEGLPAQVVARRWLSKDIEAWLSSRSATASQALAPAEDDASARAETTQEGGAA